ncbi:TonB-dependent receptor plug domain-containing protein [Phenylobacterium sp.]|uniref:TonB-dependent receptor plug domain-containing protein n=1 Tax=Phenylobacterium sp. TaxID=1871053 RepID=UPI0035B36508
MGFEIVRSGAAARGLRALKIGLLASSACALAQPAWAQAADPEEGQASSLEEVVVTGSRIAANGFQQPTPVTVLGAAEIQREMPTTVANYLNSLPAFGAPVSSTNPGPGVSGGGASLLNLRNLGVTRTLVLLDNRRVVSSSPAGGVDVNTLPTGLIQRVEVVTGGASAAWGADAVAGVVNFVLNHEYEGLTLDASTGISEEGDNWVAKMGVTYGRPFAGGRGHVLAAAEYSRQPDIVRISSRDWWRNWAVVPNPAFQAGNGQPARITVPWAGPAELAEGGVITSGPLRGTQFVGPNGSPAPFNFGTNAGVLQWGGDAAYGTSGNRNLTNGLDYGTAFTHVRYDLTDSLTAYAEASYGKSVVQTDSLYYNRGGNLTIRTDNPYLDAGVRNQLTALGQSSFGLGKMVTDPPPPGSRNERVLWRGVLGLEGRIGANWKWEAYYQRGDFHVETRTYNNPLVPRFNLAVDAVRDPATGQVVCRSTLTDRNNGCVPLNVLGNGVSSPEALAWVFGTVPYQITDLEQDVVSGSLNGDLFRLPAGAVSVAIGGEYTREEASSTQDAASAARQYFTGNFQPFEGKRNVKEAFAEAVVPLLADLPLIKRLEFNAAARLTDYSTSGSVTTWKLGGSYEVTSDLRLRVTRSRDIRAPSLSELFTRGSTGTQFVFDPQTNRQVSVLANTTGNPELTPEVATTWTAGLVYRPAWIPGFGLSVDYYDIRVRDAIAAVTAPQTVLLCFGDVPALCNNIIRDASGTITQINLLPTNVAFLETSGWDVEASYRREIGPGSLSLRVLGSYLGKLDRVEPDGTVRQLAGAIGDFVGGEPKFRGQLVATYDQGPFSGTAKVRLIGASKLDRAWVDGVDVDDNTIPRMGYLDLRAAYKLTVGGADSELSLAIDNVLNTDPPRVSAVPSTVPYVVVAPHTRLDLYDAIGRSYRVGFRARF